MMQCLIRTADERDAEQIAAIYDPIVANTIISFELEPPGPQEIGGRVARTLSIWPWLVCVRDGELLGYAYASEHLPRKAYQWAVNVSAYVNPSAHRRGIGRALYSALFEILRLQGFYTACAGISLPNAASVGLHTAMGFEPVGIYRAVGYKLGGWHDVGWWQLALRSQASEPTAPMPYPALRDSVEVRHALAQAAMSLADGV